MWDSNALDHLTKQIMKLSEIEFIHIKADAQATVTHPVFRKKSLVMKNCHFESETYQKIDSNLCHLGHEKYEKPQHNKNHFTNVLHYFSLLNVRPSFELEIPPFIPDNYF